MLDLTSSCFISGDLPIIISCASLALADAGIMMCDLVTSVSVVWLHVVSVLSYLTIS